MAIGKTMAFFTGFFIHLGFLLSFWHLHWKVQAVDLYIEEYKGTPLFGISKYSSLDFNTWHHGNFSLWEPHIWPHPNGVPQIWHFPIGFMQIPFFDDLYNFSLTGKQCFNPAPDDVQNGQQYGSGRIWKIIFQQDISQHVNSYIR